MAAIDTGAFPEVADDRARVRDAVRAVLRSRVAAEKLLGVRGAHLDRALAEWMDLDAAPTLPAAYRYSGVVWGAVGVDDMPAAARRRLMARVLVPSGLWGVVSAADPIPAYRLKIGARVAPIGLLSAFWKPRVSRRSTFLIHGVVDALSGSSGVPTRPKPLFGPRPPPPRFGNRV